MVQQFVRMQRESWAGEDWNKPVAAVLCRHRPEDCGCHLEPNHRRTCPRCSGTGVATLREVDLVDLEVVDE